MLVYVQRDAPVCVQGELSSLELPPPTLLLCSASRIARVVRIKDDHVPFIFRFSIDVPATTDSGLNDIHPMPRAEEVRGQG